MVSSKAASSQKFRTLQELLTYMSLSFLILHGNPGKLMQRAMTRTKVIHTAQGWFSEWHSTQAFLRWVHLISKFKKNIFS